MSAGSDPRTLGRHVHRTLEFVIPPDGDAAAAAQAAANAAAALAQSALASVSTAQETADGKIRCFFQATAPTGMTAGDVGDLWFDSDDNNRAYRWSGTEWANAQDSRIASAIASAQTAQTTADGKAQVHYQTDPPTGKGAGDAGDLWVDTDDNNKLWAWSGTAWIVAQDWYAAAAAANNAATAAAAAQAAANAASTAAAYADRLARSSYNLIKNGNSEDPNPTGWEAAWIRDSGAYTGTRCRALTVTVPGTYLSALVGVAPCDPGDQFVFSAWGKQATASGRQYIYIDFMDAAGARTGINLKVFPASTAYTQVEVSDEAPAGTVKVRFVIYVSLADVTTYYWDCLYAARKVSAGMLEADILKAMLVKGEVIESPNYVPGAAGVAPGGFKLAGQTFTVTYLDGSTGSANLELGEGASIAGHPALSYANLLRWRKAEFSTPGAWSWTVPPGARRVRLAIVGGGRGGKGGEGGTPSTPGGGGNGGNPGGAIVVDLDVTPGQVLSGVIGAGGYGGPAGYSGSTGTAGTAGGNTTLVAAGRTWTALGGGLSPGGATGGFGSSKASGTASRVYDPLDGLLCAGDGATARFATGTSGAKNVAASSSTGGAPSFVAAGGPGGPGATANALDGSAGLAGSRGSGGGGGGGGGGYSTSTYGGVGGPGGDGYVVIEY